MRGVNGAIADGPDAIAAAGRSAARERENVAVAGMGSDVTSARMIRGCG